MEGHDKAGQTEPARAGLRPRRTQARPQTHKKPAPDGGEPKHTTNSKNTERHD
jgi:hypothetical protein